MTGPLATLARILTYARAQRWKLALVIALSLLEMALNAQLSLSFKYLIDHAGSERTAEKLVWVTSALCLSIIIVTWSGLWRDQLYSTATAELIADLRGRLFAHLQRLSASFYTRTAPGDILSRFSNDLVDVERTILNGVPWGIIPTLDAILSTVLVFWLDWRLALLAMLAFPCSMFGPRLLSGRTATAAFARKKAEADLVSAVAENVAAQSLVRAFGLSNYFLRMFHAVNLDARSTSARLGFFALSMERSAVVSTQILQVLVLAGGGYLVFRGSMSVGSFAAFQSIFVTLSLSLAYLAQYVPQLAQAGGAVAHIEELLHEAPQVRDDEKAAELPSLSRGIELRDVRFSYDGSQMNLDKVSLAIECGTSVAFVGPSGSGKSTILSMVMRFYDPVEGTVLVDGHDLRAVSSHSLRAQTAVVFQDNFLLHGSIQDNIRIARPSATAVEIDEAIRQAGLEDFISTLPLGKNTIVGQSRLSGGQRQRLGIARALLRNPRILLLDEATSALDSATEAMINATLEHVSRGRTVLSVTHRLGSAVKADRIFFLDKGRIVEQGTHQQLLALNGAYARMWNKQSGFELSAQGDHARISPDRLRAIPLLAELNDDILTELSRSFSTELYSKDHVLFNEGDAGDRFFILVRGTVEVLKTTAGGGTRRVEVLQDGDVFGEQALLLNAPRSASVRCVAECTALVLTRDKFQTMIDRSPELRWKLRESASIGEYRNDEAVAGLVSPWSKFRHDLLTPVNHIAGYGQILADDFQDSNDAAAAAKAASICSAAKELQAGIDQLLPSGRTPATDVIARLSRELTEPLHRIATAVSAIRSSSQRSRQVLEDALRIETAVTSFRDLLQNSHQPAALAKSRNSSRYNGASTAAGHILVVDDNSTSRDLLCRKLERDGYAVSFAAGGEAAIEIESSHKFDLVLLDVMMPDIDGFQVLQHWKANRTLDRLPVIVTSAMDEVSSAVRCIELGAEDYLTKPFDPVLLKARIGACIEKKRLRDGERARAERLRSALETYGEKGKAVAS